MCTFYDDTLVFPFGTDGDRSRHTQAKRALAWLGFCILILLATSLFGRIVRCTLVRFTQYFVWGPFFSLNIYIGSFRSKQASHSLLKQAKRALASLWFCILILLATSPFGRIMRCT